MGRFLQDVVIRSGLVVSCRDLFQTSLRRLKDRRLVRWVVSLPWLRYQNKSSQGGKSSTPPGNFQMKLMLHHEATMDLRT